MSTADNDTPEARKQRAERLRQKIEDLKNNKDGGTIPQSPREFTDAAARKALIRALVARGEAVVPNADGTLPLGATHAIIGYEEDGTPILERRRIH